MKYFEKYNFMNLTDVELRKVLGGTLLEDIGCAAHKVSCAVESAYNSVKDWAVETYNDIVY